MGWLARVEMTGGALVLTDEWRWQAESVSQEFADVLALNADIANWEYAAPNYRYSPAHGVPGAMVAADVARRWKGTVKLPTPGIVIPDDVEFIS